MTITRFAPSPTGHLHIGNLRAALFNFAIARKAGGQFILRLDDTDTERSRQEYIDGIYRDLEWLGLEWDRVERQSERLDLYADAQHEFITMGRLYEAFETPTELDLKRKKQLNMGRPPVYDRAALSLSDDERAALRAERAGHWRFRLDHARIEWTDGILGALSIDAASVSDPVLIKESGQVLYTLASVVDDTDMGITDVVRGSDHVTNTATQIQMIEALGRSVPRFAHHSLLTGPEGEKLSKRIGALSLKDLREAGIEPMAILSLMARLGSSQPVDLCSDVDQIVAGFELDSFGSAPTKFDPADLRPMSARVLAQKTLPEVAGAVADAGVPDALAATFWDAVRENIETLDDLSGWWGVFRDGTAAVIADEDADFVAEAFSMLGEPPYTDATWSEWTSAVKDATGRKGKGLFLPLRRAVTGRDRGPEMAAVMALLQRKPG